MKRSVPERVFFTGDINGAAIGFIQQASTLAHVLGYEDLSMQLGVISDVGSLYNGYNALKHAYKARQALTTLREVTSLNLSYSWIMGLSTNTITANLAADVLKPIVENTVKFSTHSCRWAKTSIYRNQAEC